jgi:hypothetical protein
MSDDERERVKAAVEALVREWWGDGTGEWNAERLGERIRELAEAAGVPVPPWGQVE